MPNRFYKSSIKNAPECKCLQETLKPFQSRYLVPNCDPLRCRNCTVHKLSKFGAFLILLRCLHIKQASTDCIGSVSDCTGFYWSLFVPPAQAEESCTELLEQSVYVMTSFYWIYFKFGLWNEHRHKISDTKLWGNVMENGKVRAHVAFEGLIGGFKSRIVHLDDP